MRSSDFWAALEEKAEELGFSEIGMTPVDSLEKEAEYLETWLAEGNAGDMEYMKRTKEVRKDTRLFFPGAKGVLVATVNYYRETTPSDSPWKGENRGRIARYAAGRDYHKVIKKMLLRLVEFLRGKFFPESTKEDFRISLDAHPVLERAWAGKAELGFFGKNTCLITEKSGSWVLIGCIFTTQRIPRKPETFGVRRLVSGGMKGQREKGKEKKKERLQFSKLSCGNCTRCLDACPTKAIVAPGKIDARKCISYLTIENKGGIPVELREKIGDRLFGCDICQEVCPFNIPRQRREKNPMMEKEIAGTEVLLEEILQIETDEQFLERFAGSPLMRAKRRGLLRNACVVAGNSGNRKLLPILKKVVERENDDMLTEHAEWAIERIES